MGAARLSSVIYEYFYPIKWFCSVKNVVFAQPDSGKFLNNKIYLFIYLHTHADPILYLFTYYTMYSYPCEKMLSMIWLPLGPSMSVYLVQGYLNILKMIK